MNINGINMTKPVSYVTVIYSPQLQSLIIDHPFDKVLWRNISKIKGAKWDDVVPNKWILPKHSKNELDNILGRKVKWNTSKERKDTIHFLQREEETLNDVLKRIPPKISTPYLNLTPFDFQKIAVGWASTLKGKRAQIYGGLLADKMGLGKTIEGLAISSHLKSLGKINKCLIVVPATLKSQWIQEIEKTTNENVILIDGNKKKRKQQYELAALPENFYTVVNYDLLIEKERIGKKYSQKEKKNKILFGDYYDLEFINNINYDMIICDEAHQIKNPDTQKSKVIRQIHPPFKLLMTGTPIQKDIQDIFTLIDYLSPNILANEEMSFKQRWNSFSEQFLVYGLNQNALPKWVPEIKYAKNKGRLKEIISPYMLRRTTEEVSDELPQQIENTVVVNWDNKQSKLYIKIKEHLNDLQEKLSKAKDDETREKLDTLSKAMINYLLAVCDSPELLTRSESQLTKRILGKTKDGKPHKYKNPPKLERLVDMVDEITNSKDEKVVIFTKYEQMAQIINRELTSLFNSQKKTTTRIETYTGKTKQGCKWKTTLQQQKKDSKNLSCIECPFKENCSTRTKAAWHFQNDPLSKVIIATDAGNFGVNLQSGCYLINYELPDDFSTYDQRKGRITRLGSKYKQVYIYNLVTDGGVDQAKLKKLERQEIDITDVVEKNTNEEEALKKVKDKMNEALIQDVLNKKGN